MKGLLDREVCQLVPRAEVPVVCGTPVANGWFGRGKGKFLPNMAESESPEILRFIMNLVPTNSLLHIIEGDIATLPYIGMWSRLQLASM